MSQKEIQINIDIPAPVDKVFADFSDHEKLGPVLGAKITRIRDGEERVNGVGSVRRLNVGPLPPIEETVTAFRENELIEYRITNRTPLKNHCGTMKFSESNGVTHLDYNIVFESRIPLTGGLIRKALQDTIVKGCKRYAASVA